MIGVIFILAIAWMVGSTLGYFMFARPHGYKPWNWRALFLPSLYFDWWQEHGTRVDRELQ